MADAIEAARQVYPAVAHGPLAQTSALRLLFDLGALCPMLVALLSYSISEIEPWLVAPESQLCGLVTALCGVIVQLNDTASDLLLVWWPTAAWRSRQARRQLCAWHNRVAFLQASLTLCVTHPAWYWASLQCALILQVTFDSG